MDEIANKAEITMTIDLSNCTEHVPSDDSDMCDECYGMGTILINETCCRKPATGAYECCGDPEQNWEHCNKCNGSGAKIQNEEMK